MLFNYYSNPSFNPYMFYPCFMNHSIFTQKNQEFQHKILQNIVLHSQKPAQNQINLKLQQNNFMQDTSISGQLDLAQRKNQPPKRQKKIRKIEPFRCQIGIKKGEKKAKNCKKSHLLQKQGRNSHSNIFRKFFKLLSVQPQVEQIVKKIIKAQNLLINQGQFFAELRKNSIDHRNYIRVKEVTNFLQVSKSEVSKIIRVLFKNYLDNFYKVHLLSSKKTDRKSIYLHLQGRRTIESQLGWGPISLVEHSQDQIKQQGIESIEN